MNIGDIIFGLIIGTVIGIFASVSVTDSHKFHEIQACAEKYNVYTCKIEYTPVKKEKNHG